MCKNISWSDLYSHRRAAAARLGGIFDLPLVKRVRDVLANAIDDGARVLEVGAGDRHLGSWLSEARRGVRYESMDVDPLGHHDFRRLDDVTGPYQCVFALEVIEHLPFEAIGEWLLRLAALLEPRGRLVLSTPNTFYPPAFLRDATHRTPLCYDELAGLAACCGLYVVRVARVYHDPIHRRIMRRYVFGWLFRLLGIDFARQIVLVAEKPEAAA